MNGPLFSKLSVLRSGRRLTEHLADKAHPGKELTSGFFGFAGHNDPVMFRNIAIKRL